MASLKAGTTPDLTITDFGERLTQYKDFIKELLSLYDKHSVSETDGDVESKIYHNTIVYCSVKNAIFTVIQRELRDYCEEKTPIMVTFTDEQTMQFWEKFLSPTNDEDVDMLFDITNDVVASLT